MPGKSAEMIEYRESNEHSRFYFESAKRCLDNQVRTVVFKMTLLRTVVLLVNVRFPFSLVLHPCAPLSHMYLCILCVCRCSTSYVCLSVRMYVESNNGSLKNVIRHY